jgi:glutathione synthase/RimK-type ligase-like ATP-grasp enzyme
MAPAKLIIILKLLSGCMGFKIFKFKKKDRNCLFFFYSVYLFILSKFMSSGLKSVS